MLRNLPGEARDRNARYRARNRERLRQQLREWKRAHPDRVALHRQTYYERKKATDPTFMERRRSYIREYKRRQREAA